jgi:L-ascorbate metabolism protein UlaG (beta-lactamase superfamily)
VQRSRRNFLKFFFAAAGGTAALSAYWLSTSQRRVAHWLRTIAADTRRAAVSAPIKPQPEKWSDQEVTICWLGHATVLINFYGIHILTDPTFSSRVGVPLGIGTAGPKRYVAPALRMRELPPIDVLLVSHAHMDHMDLPSLRRIAPGTFTVTAPATGDLLAAARLKQVTELRWNDSVTFRSGNGELDITAFEVRHWGRRWPSSIDRGYNGYVLRREGRAILFGGDTAHTPLFSELRSGGPYDAAIMPIAAYDPWIHAHCTPEEALEMADDAGARYFVPVHHQTFRLSDEPLNEPIERLDAALEREPERLALRKIGGSFVCPRA